MSKKIKLFSYFFFAIIIILFGIYLSLMILLFGYGGNVILPILAFIFLVIGMAFLRLGIRSLKK